MATFSKVWKNADLRKKILFIDLRRGPQGAALLASGKASPQASSSGASQIGRAHV